MQDARSVVECISLCDGKDTSSLSHVNLDESHYGFA